LKSPRLTAPLLGGTKYDEQIKLETDAVEAGVRRYREAAEEAISRGDGASLKPAERLMVYWFVPLCEAISNIQRSIRRGEPDKNRAVYGRPMVSLDAERLAVISLHEVIGTNFGTKKKDSDLPANLMSNVAYQIGKAVFAEIHMDMLRKREQSNSKRYRDRMKEEGGEALRKRFEGEERVFNNLLKRTKRMTAGRMNWWARKQGVSRPDWNTPAAAHLGMELAWTVISSCGFPCEDGTMVPAFLHKKRTIRSGGQLKKYGFVEMSDQSHKIIDEGHAIREQMRPRYLPMVVPPCPWQESPAEDKQSDMGAVGGGYIHIRTPLLSKPTGEQKAAVKNANMRDVYECLNAVGATAWRVNKPALKDVSERWGQGGGDLYIPRADKIPLPPRAESDDIEAVKASKQARSAVYAANIQLKAERREFLHRLSVANRFKDHGDIYFPHQLDFRGRAYPIPPHLHHQGDDLCRGLLEFGEAVPLTDEGERWLYIHAANCYGVDKVSFDDRIKWTRDNIPGIVDSANGGDFWEHADESGPNKRDGKPWQFLAACRAITDRDAASHIPVQVDGSANGLQWYAALGRDETAAALVNLLPGDKPGNLYGSVADTVRRVVAADADAGDPIAAAMLRHVERSVVKQPVMTFNYGVTAVGARGQIKEQLEKRGVAGDELYKGSVYLANRTLEAVSTLFPVATAIMGWLRECAKIIVKQGRAVRWNTPLGMPCVQPGRNFRRVEIDTVLQILTLQVEDSTLPVKPQSQINGLPPNYVHSLDATHMLMTARACRREGIAFAGVHDSFWVHASHVLRLGAILREQFLILVRRPLLHELREQFTAYYKLDFPEPPPQGTLDVEQVAKSPYFFH